MGNEIARGCKNMAQRIVQAEADFVATLMDLGGIDHATAERVLAHYRKIRVVRMDAVMGRVTVKHGAFLDREVIERAALASAV